MNNQKNNFKNVKLHITPSWYFLKINNNFFMTYFANNNKKQEIYR